MKRIIALAALILFAMTGTAQAKADDPKDACKHGGFSQYVDPATGQPFTSQSPCVSFVAQGGTLVPVEKEPPPVVEPTIAIVNISDAVDPPLSTSLGKRYTYTVQLSGWMPDSVFMLTYTYPWGAMTEAVGPMDSSGSMLYSNPDSTIGYCNEPVTIMAMDSHAGLVATVGVPRAANC